MALEIFNLGPGACMSGQIGVPSIFGGPKILVTLCEKYSIFLGNEKERVTNFLIFKTVLSTVTRINNSNNNIK